MEENGYKIKKFLLSYSKKIIGVVFVIGLIVILLSISAYFMTEDDATNKDGDWSSTGYGASQYINNIKVESDGTLSNDMSVQELWDKLLENGCRVNEYLDTPEELARLMKAEIVTQYPDTRENPDEEINWEDIVKDSDTLQGIIKLKRADDKNNKTTMKYSDPETFQRYIDEYNRSGSQNAKEYALTHFTLKKSSSASGSGTSAVAAGDGVMTDVSQAIINATNTTPWPGSQYCQRWVRLVYENAGLNPGSYATAYEASQHNVISKDRSAIPIGAAVYGTGVSSGGAGHVGIYIGSGKVIDSQSSGIVVSTMEKWLSWQTDVIEGKQGWLGWGWADGNKIRGTTQDPNVTQNKNNSTELTNTSEKTKNGTVTNVSGDGYSQKYTSSAGITYKHYKQIEGSYSRDPYWDRDIYWSGCGPTSIAILASGLTSYDYTPGDIAAQMKERGGGNTQTSSTTLKEEMDSLGLTSEIIDSPSGDVIQNNLKNGKVMLVSVNQNTIFTGSSHIMAIVDINSDGQVYICNPSSNTLYGWFDITEITKGCKYIVTTDAGAAGIANSTNESTYVAVVATWQQIDTTVTTNDPMVKAYSETKYAMTTANVNYQEMVDSYTMPFDLIWAFMVVGKDKEFAFALADLVYNSDIQITIYDNLTVNTDIDEWNYTKQEKAIVDADITAIYADKTASASRVGHLHDPHSETPNHTVKTVITQTNTINAVLTRANVWAVDYINDYTYVAPNTTNGEPNVVTKPNQEYPSEPSNTGTSFNCEHIEQTKKLLAQSVIDKYLADKKEIEIPDTLVGDNAPPPYIPNIKPSISSVRYNESYYVEYFQRYINISDTITNTVKTQKYTKGVPKLTEKTDPDSDEPNFVTLFNNKKYKQNRRNILSAPSWLFEIIETNDSTTDMLDLIKYLLYKATGTNYGVKKISFEEIFTMKTSSSFGQISGNDVKEQVWNYLTSAGFTDEAAAAVMGNMEAESGVDPTCIQSGGAGPAAGICQWENYNTKTGRWKALYDYAENRGKDWTDLQSQLDFLMGELETQFTAYTGHGKHYYDNGEWCWWPTAMTSEEYKTLTNIEEATEIFCRVVERPSIPHLDRRINAAQEYYNLYH